MLTAAGHFGGATNSGTAVFNAVWGGPRVIRCAPVAGFAIATLPSLIEARSDMLVPGRPHFYVINTGSVAINIQDIDFTFVDTIAANKWAAYAVSKSSGGVLSWRKVLSGATNSSLNASTNRVSAIANPETAPTYNSFCLFENICEWLGGLGNGPLTGGGGSEEILAPFYQDVTVHARNSNREPIRACDCVMPSKIAVRFTDGDFTADPAHPGAGTYSLSTYFFDALHRRDTNSGVGPGAEPHILEFDAAASPLTEKTGNWHHVARVGNYLPSVSWQHGPTGADLSAMKYFWKKEIQYGPPDNPTAYTLRIVLTMEHTLGSAVRLDPENDGGPSGELLDGLTQERGLWGALFTLAIFTNEIYPSFVENSTTFKPLGWTGATTWRRTNPALHGLCNQVVGVETNPETKRGVHPQCVALAHLPTTFHAPIGRMWKSQANNEFYKEFLGPIDEPARNLDDCLLVPNGSPWLTTTSCTDPCPCRQSTWPNDSWGIFENIVFGYPPGSPGYYMGKGMTLGGDMKRSKPMEWFCWENGGTGSGRTFLRVSRPGWSETCGRLDVPGGNSGEIWVCVDDGDCPLGNDQCGGDAGEWPTTIGVSNCDGHPIEPYMGVGGSHTCFRSAAGSQLNKDTAADEPIVQPAVSNYVCCTPPRDTVISAYEYCTRNTITYGDPLGGGGCEIIGSECFNTNTFWTQWLVFYTQYTMCPNANQLNRSMSWTRILPDPDPNYALRNWTYSNTDADLIDDLGTFTRGASSLTVATVSGTNPIRAHCRYNKWESGGGTSWEWFGCDITCGFSGVSATGPQGIGFLDTNQNGYGLNVVKVGSDMVMQVARYSNNVKTVISSHTFTGQGGNNTGTARFRIHGVDIIAEYTPNGQPKNTITVTDGVEWQRQNLVARVPDFSSPPSDSQSVFYPSFYTEHTAAGSIFDTFANPLITDFIPKFLTISGAMGVGSLSTSLQASLMEGFGECEDSSPNILTCGSNEANCNCTAWQDQMHRSTSSSHSGGDIVTNQFFDGCIGTDNARDPDSPRNDGNPQYHGGPSPARFQCRGNQCTNGEYSCGNCPPSELPRILFTLPTDPLCWDGRSNPDCLGTTPLLCYGIDSYSVSIIVCL